MIHSQSSYARNLSSFCLRSNIRLTFSKPQVVKIMDLLAELNSLASTAILSDTFESIPEACKRWQNLFNYSLEEAKSHIASQRAGSSSSTVSQELWDAVQFSSEAHGHDRESYAHFLDLFCRRKVPSTATGSAALEDDYIFKMSRPFDTADAVQRIADSSARPVVRTGVSTSEDDQERTERFCVVNGSAKQRLTDWATEHRLPCPHFIRISMARKDLSSDSWAPCLGYDMTLPQNRLIDREAVPRPRQDEYPVWYFCYGTLQDPEKLRAVFSEEEGSRYELWDAKIRGGSLIEWGNKYKALVDDCPGLYGGGGEVVGKALLVETKEHEDALRFYETKAYEVVRCGIVFGEGSEEVAACTFRYTGVRR